MPRVPYAPRPDVIAAPYQGAAPADTTAKYRGQMALAQGIGAAGDAMQRFALQSQQIQNEAALARGRLAMHQAKADLQQDLEANPDPEQWEQLAQTRFEQASGAIFASQEGARLAPAVRRQLEQDFSAWSQDNLTQVKYQALRKRNDEADKLFVQEQGLAVANADLPRAIAAVDQRETLGLISPARAIQERKAVAHDVDVQAVSRDILADPFLALQKLEDQTEGGKYRHFRELSERDRLAAVRSAKNAMETERAETVQRLQEDILTNGGLGAETKIDSWLEAGRILPSQAVNLKKFAAGQRRPQDMAAEGSRLWQAAIDLDPADPEALQREMQIRAAAHTLDPIVRDPILDTLNEKRDAKGTPPIVQQAFSLLQRDYQTEVAEFTAQDIEALTRAEKKAYETKFGRKPEAGLPKDPSRATLASEKLFRHQLALRDFIMRNPKATPEQILTERARLTASDQQAVLGALAIEALSGARQ